MNEPAEHRELQDILAILRDADAGLRGRQPKTWLDRLAAQHEQLDRVLRWCQTENQSDLGLEISGVVWPYWLHRGRLSEGTIWLEALLATTSAARPSIGRARSLAGAGTIAFFRGDLVASAERLHKSLTIAEHLHFAQGIAEAHSGLSRIAMAKSAPDQIRQHSQTALSAARAAADEQGIAIAIHHIAHASLIEGNLPEAERLYSENIETFRGMERYELLASELHNLGHVACLRGDANRAQLMFRESLNLGQEVGSTALLPYNIIGFGRVAVALGNLEHGTVLLGAGTAMLRREGKALLQLLRPGIENAIAEARVVLSTTRFEAAMQRGSALSSDELFAMIAKP